MNLDDLKANDDGSRSDAAGVVVHQPWMAQNPDDLKINAGLAKFKDLGALSTAVIENDGKMGELNTAMEELKGTSIQKLGDEPTAEQENVYYNALGRPEKPEAYEIVKPTELPPGFVDNEAFDLEFRKIAHGTGMNQKQTAAMADFLMKDKITDHNATITRIKEKRTAAVDELKKDWPGDYFEKNGAQAKRAMMKLGEKIPEFAKFMDESGFGDIPNVLRLFHSAFQVIGNDYFVPGSDGGGDDNTLPGQPKVFKSYGSMKTT